MKTYGLDTETPLGKLGCIATNEEVIEATTFEEVVSFLSKKKHRSSVFWTFNLQFDVEHILKSTNDRDFLQDLYENGVRRPGLKYQGCNIQYIPRKLFKLCKNGMCATFYDIAQFFNGASLQKASMQYLNTGKLPDVNAEKIGSEEGYYESNKQLVLEYCKRDASLTLALAKVVEGTFTSNGISFRTPISQAKISEMYVRDHYKYPKVPEKLQEAHSWAHESYHGGLFWTLQRGFFRQPLYSFDINSAYPSVMAKLPHWGNGLFKWCDAPGDGEYGWYACEFNCPWIPMEEFKDGYQIDICYRDKELKLTVNPKRIIYPNGTRRAVVTKVEYEWMKAHNYQCRFITGLEWHFKENKYPSPFEWMAKIYEKRIALKETDKTGMLQYALKILLNGLYGKTAQAKKGMGILTNFFYASYITATTRLQVAEVALKHLSAVVEIATDSVTLTKDISAEIPISKALGEWGLDEYKEGLFIGSGMRQEWYPPQAGPLPNPSPSGGGTKGGGVTSRRRDYVTYARGLTDKRDFDMLGFLTRYREDSEAWFTRKRPIHLGEMIVHYKALKFEDLGVFTSIRKRLNVNTDKKQNWERDYDNFGDFLDSKTMRGKYLEV
jgi:DNA polymerase elongation subunit (family B)